MSTIGSSTNYAGGSLNYPQSVQKTDRSVSADNRRPSDQNTQANDAVTQRITTENYREVLGPNADALLSPQDMKQLFEQGHLDVQRSMSMQESSEGFLTITSKLAAALIGPSKSIGAISIDPLFMEMIKDPNAEIGAGFTRVYNESLTVIPSSAPSQTDTPPPVTPPTPYNPPTQIGAIDYDWREPVLDDAAPPEGVPTTTETEETPTDRAYMVQINSGENSDIKWGQSTAIRNSEEFGAIKEFEQDGAPGLYNGEFVADATWSGAYSEALLQDRDLYVRHQYVQRASLNINSDLNGTSDGSWTNKMLDYVNKKQGTNYTHNDLKNPAKRAEIKDKIAQTFGFNSFEDSQKIVNQAKVMRSLGYVGTQNPQVASEQVAGMSTKASNSTLAKQISGTSIKNDGTTNHYDNKQTLKSVSLDQPGLESLKEKYPGAQNMFDVYQQQTENTNLPENAMDEYATLYKEVVGKEVSVEQLKADPPKLKDLYALRAHQFRPNALPIDKAASQNGKVVISGESPQKREFISNVRLVLEANNSNGTHWFDQDTIDAYNAFTEHNMKGVSLPLKDNMGNVVATDSESTIERIKINPDEDIEDVDTMKFELGRVGSIQDDAGNVLATLQDGKLMKPTGETDAKTGKPEMVEVPREDQDAYLTSLVGKFKPQVLEGGVGHGFVNRPGSGTVTTTREVINTPKVLEDIGGATEQISDPNKHYNPETIQKFEAYSQAVKEKYGDNMPPEVKEKLDALDQGIAAAKQRTEEYVAQGPNKEAGLAKVESNIQLLGSEGALKEIEIGGEKQKVMDPKTYDNIRPKVMEDILEISGMDLTEAKTAKGEGPFGKFDAFPADYTAKMEDLILKDKFGTKEDGSINFPEDYNEGKKDAIIDQYLADKLTEMGKPEAGQNLITTMKNARDGVKAYSAAQAAGALPSDNSVAGVTGHVNGTLKSLNEYVGKAAQDGTITKEELTNIRSNLRTTEQGLANSLGLQNVDELRGLSEASPALKGKSDSEKLEILNTVSLLKKANANINLASESGSMRDSLSRINSLKKDLDEFETVKVMTNAFKGEMKTLATNSPEKFKTLMRATYFPNSEPTEAQEETLDKLLKNAQEGNIPLPANIQFVDSEQLKGNNAAYAKGGPQGPTILLNRNLMGQDGRLSEALAEEMFHHLEASVRGDNRDVDGDEGDGGMRGMRVAMRGGSETEIRSAVEQGRRAQGANENGSDHLGSLTIGDQTYTDIEFQSAGTYPVVDGNPTTTTTTGGQPQVDPNTSSNPQGDAPQELDMAPMMNQVDHKPGFFSSETLMGALMGLTTPEAASEKGNQRYDMWQTELYDKNHTGVNPMEKKSTNTPLQDIMKMLQERSDNLKATWSKIAKEGIASIEGTQAEEVINHGFDVGRGANEDKLTSNLATKTANNYDVNPNYGDANKANSAKYNDYYGNANKQRQTAQSMAASQQRMQARAEAQNNQRTSG